MEVVSENKSHGGRQLVVKHASTSTSTDMTFSIFLPPQVEREKCPVVWYLSGLTCTHANVTEKGEYRAACAELGLIFVAPDTSPRGEGVPDADEYDFGKGAGFYVDATQEPWSANYRMWSYVTDELPKLVAAEFTAGVPVIETDLAPGPNQRRSFCGQRLRRRIIFPIFRIFHWPRP